MAQTAYRMLAASGGLVFATIRFFPDTASDPAVEDPGGIVSTIVHTATGKYTITLKEAPFNIVACVASIAVVGDSTNAYAQGGVESGATIIVKTKADGTNTDFAEDDDTHVDVILVLKTNTSP